MGEIINYFKNVWGELIRHKGERVERRAKELLSNKVNHVESNTHVVLHVSEDLNTGKLGKLIRWLTKK